MSENLQRITRKVERTEHFNELRVGDWFWVKNGGDGEDKDDSWLGCIIHVGTNYVELRGPSDSARSYYHHRVHLNEFEDLLTYEPDAERIIQGKVDKQRQVSEGLMGQVKQLTAGLAITPRGAIDSGNSDTTQAIAIRGNTQPVEEYKTALIKAKDELLPKLFKELRESNELMSSWMSAAAIPLEAQAKSYDDLTGIIKDRVFNVELYAGLSEQVDKIKDGTPAGMTEKVYLFQRRCYMDEECLANYQTGGMDFKNIEDFDKWLCKPENISRLLPHQRCVVAFQVRRYTKDRGTPVSLRGYIDMFQMEQADKWTFMYIRNGEQVFRMNTQIEFGAELFPDQEHANMDGVLYAKLWGSSKVQDVIDESRYLGLKEDYEKKLAVYKADEKRLKKAGIPRSEWGDHSEYFSRFSSWKPEARNYHGEYERYSPDSVYYDDITEYIQKQIDEHNRLVLVLQGLFDRSEVFHPHPPLQLWTPEGFTQAMELVYDNSRGLVAGSKPDFEFYRKQLNKSLKVGCVTYGQDDYWATKEAEKENRRRENDYRFRDSSDLITYRPYGDPGPGVLARVRALGGKRGALYFWERDRVGESRRYESSTVNRKLHVPVEELFNVSAYTPGDFKIFFNDPRTRAEYLQWAPMLLEAEEYHAGNRKIGK